MPFTLLGAPPELGVSPEPIAWMDWILLITQTGVIVAAVFAPLLAHKLAQRRAERERDLKNRNTQSAIRAELLYLVAFYDEIWGFWNETGRYADHFLPAASIDLPPLLSTPQVWAENLPIDDRNRLSELLTKVHHYNQILRELQVVERSDSHLRNAARARKVFDSIGRYLIEFGFPLNPWKQGDPDPML